MLRQLVLPNGIVGAVYLSGMPGRYDSLDADVANIDSVGVGRIISFASSEEVASKSPEYAAAVSDAALGLLVETFAIPDFGVPSDPLEFANLVNRLVGYLEADERLLLHCGAGIGRTGTVAVCLLIALGMGEAAALGSVKAAGSGPETEEQRRFVERFAVSR